MHITKYSRRPGRGGEGPKDGRTIGDEEISRIASEIALRLPGSSSATAEEVMRIVHEAMTRFQSRFDEAFTKIAETRVTAPAEPPPPQPPIGEEIARQNDMLVSKMTGVLATQLGAALAAKPAADPTKMAPEEIERIANSVAQGVVTAIDEGIGKVRQAIAGLAAAVRSAVPQPLDPEEVAARTQERVRGLLAAMPRVDTERVSESVVKEVLGALVRLKDSLKPAAPVDPEALAVRVEEKVRALLAEAPRGDAGALAREIAALQQTLLPQVREEVSGIVEKRASRSAKELRRDVWAVEQKVQQIIDEELERKLMWIVPGLVGDGVRVGLEESVRPEKFAAASAKLLREKLTRDLDAGARKIFGRDLDRRLRAAVRRLIARAVRETFPTQKRLRQWAAEGARAAVAQRLRKELGRALKRELARPKRAKAKAPAAAAKGKRPRKSAPSREVPLSGILKAVVDKPPQSDPTP